MNALFRILFLVTLVFAAAAPRAADTPAAKAGRAATPPLTPRFIQVRERIDALFRHRNAAPPVLDPRFNPFRPPGSASAPVPAPVAKPAAREPAADPAPADLALLQQAVAGLKVNGIFEKDGQFHLVLNARPYKNGDIIQTQVQGQAIYIRVRDISRHSVSLELNEAEMTLKF